MLKNKFTCLEESTIKIINLSKKEIAAVGYLLNEYRKFYNQPSDLEAATQFIKERFENNESTIYVAIEKDKVVGFVQLYPTFSTVSLKSAYILNDLYVESTSRKKGIAKALIEYCYDFCKQKNARYITLETSVTNESAQKLYEKMGMHIEDDVYHYSKNF